MALNIHYTICIRNENTTKAILGPIPAWRFRDGKTAVIDLAESFKKNIYPNDKIVIIESYGGEAVVWERNDD